jgi:hypothetical protein
MGIFSEVELSFKRFCCHSYGVYYWREPVSFWKYGSFSEYAFEQSKYYSLLNDGLIINVYLFGNYAFSNKLYKDKKELADLFLSCLKDKGYSRYIKLIR